MKFTHCDYKYKSAPTNAAKGNIHSRKMRVASSRADLKRDTEYYASWICIYATDKDITEFTLGIDYSYPNQTIRDRCEGRLFLNFIVKGNSFIPVLCKSILYSPIPTILTSPFGYTSRVSTPIT